VIDPSDGHPVRTEDLIPEVAADPRGGSQALHIVWQDIRFTLAAPLPYSGSREDLPLIVAALGDEDRDARAAARGSLGNVGGQAAADALAADLERDQDDDEVDQDVEALAWLGDERGLEPARQRARAELANAGSRGPSATASSGPTARAPSSGNATDGQRSSQGARRRLRRLDAAASGKRACCDGAS
jgi:hypothetical protein